MKLCQRWNVMPGPHFLARPMMVCARGGGGGCKIIFQTWGCVKSGNIKPETLQESQHNMGDHGCLITATPPPTPRHFSGTLFCNQCEAGEEKVGGQRVPIIAFGHTRSKKLRENEVCTL